MADRTQDLQALDATLTSIEKVLDLPKLRLEVRDLEEQAGLPDLWDDPTKAQEVTGRLSVAQGDITRVEGYRSRLEDLGLMYEMAAEEADESALAEAEAELATLQREIGSLEVRTLLSGPYDEREALVQITPGAGGVDSQDWAMMLWRMYARWAERKGYPIDVLEWQDAEEAGVKSVVFQVKAPYAYGTLAGEHGVHRLVRISPFDNQARRQTSFAALDVTPVVAGHRRGRGRREGHPGRRLPLVRAPAGRASTRPTPRCASRTCRPASSCPARTSAARSRTAPPPMIVLATKLLERKREEELATMNDIRGAKADVAFGSQIRNYVLHPYQMVKDLRTGMESGSTGPVLDGEIDDFVEAAIRWRREVADAPPDAL